MPTYGYANTTNLGVQIQMLRSRLAEPYEAAIESSTTEGYFRDAELVDFIYQAELRIAKDLPNDALVGLQTVVSRTTANGTATYKRPTLDQTVADDPPILRLIAVELDTGSGLYPCRNISRKDLWRVDDHITHRADSRHPIFAFDDSGNVIVRPVPGSEAGAAKLKFRYLKVPPRRYKHIRGTVDSATTTTIVDADTGKPADFWETDGKSSIRMASGDLIGEERMIQDWTPSTFTVDFAFSEAPAVADEYIAGQVSDLGDEFNDMVIAYATYLAKLKDSEVEEANLALGEYNSGVQSIHSVYGGTRGGEQEAVSR